MTDIQTWEPIVKELQSATKILVSSHLRPDGDAVGAGLAFSRLLKKMGKERTLVLQDDPGKMYHPFYEKNELTLYHENLDFSTFDLIVLLDAGEWYRMGEISEKLDYSSWNKTCIDHHPPMNDFEGLRYVDESASSTTLLIYRLLKHLEIELTPDLAEPIYLGMMTDTQNFHLNNTTEEAHGIAAECLRAGVKPESVHEPVYGTLRFSQLNLRTAACQTIELHAKGTIGTMYTTQKMFQEAGAEWWEDEGFCDLVRSIEKVIVGIYFREEPDGSIKVSWRSKGEIDISISARSFGGGGHKRAAGAVMNLPIQEAKSRTLQELYDRLGEDLVKI